MTNRDRIGLTWISFFSYALTGAVVIVTGMVLENIAAYFQLPVAQMSNTFTFLNAGILLAVFLNAWLMEIVPLKRQIIFGFVLMVLAVLGLMNSHSLGVFSLCMFVLGVVSGITMSIGTFLITHLYEGRQRGSRLLFTDSFFSMAGTLFPIIAAAILARSLPWYWVYACIAVIYVAIFILALCFEFPQLGKKAVRGQPVVKEKWGLGVALLAVAALCYILGQLGFIGWVPQYATKNMGLNITEAGSVVGHFWTAYMVGMWAFSAILRFFDPQRIVTVLALISTLLMYWFISTTDASMLKWIMMSLGFFSSAIYTTIITLGSLQTKVSSPKLVNFILTCGTIGTMLTFVVTGPIVDKAGFHAALATTNGLYAVVFLMCLLLGFVSKHKQHGHMDAH
ncbi:MFS transporter TsgA [Erwinia amylovora]|uniref:Protein TsgA homolog n=4 Tax=Erwinia amylovora TaxID=552 RepID=A0A831A2I0_ERWAM|nr:MFS transporter TsgA [Erwinia amylovora]CBX82318.1 putative MFS transporter [Erwinia amylovora ATCC BAA-2158]CCP04703.1 Putative MFS transporter [Erwinia amylovora Ea644]CCP08769.1 Putative MFS transporter [Erwinia amylovora MR1]CDK16739.1 putative MFS transporter [Erwinia amylovora LA635]CDK20107.1 putative MFS transporter [Erwinia amylovora LA636]CDK23478.1 putative MFS transporter [Erwinia amylovora LA637]